ncbi:MAG: hypothetical protein Kow00124_00990 [Anaerolineae bacterium]
MHHTDTPLHQHIAVDEGFYAAYEAYEPDLPVIERIRLVQPTAHVITPSRYTCPDCARNIPHMARIAEHLPGWTWEVFDSSDQERRAALGIIRIPTFIVYDRPGGKELGRIIENPASGSLEHDLLAIVER